MAQIVVSQGKLTLLTTLGALMILFSVAGCGSSATANVGSVGGIVTLDGNPLAGASITFQPQQGRPASGGTDEKGFYGLSYSNDQSGAIVGRCEVRISTAFEDEDGKVSPEQVPRKYLQPGALTADVKPGSNDINFDLVSK